jgi:hypothetical protein
VISGRPPVTVADHETLDRGTPRSIIRSTRLTVDDFLALISR